ncbi:MAG TPA: AMP-binding protein [Steroidobacteraceae bacterium]|nr:AMP-binding protein [Steroidobacteraceae bacterium]
MSAVTTFAGFMKKHVLGQTLIRRNPYYYDRSSNVLERGETWEYERRRTWVGQHVRRTLQLAKRAEYGRSVRGGDTLASWPLLDKESLRHGLSAFTTGYKWLSSPATTGGTSGVPLKVLRSLEAIVFEQATIDRVIRSVGVDARTARTVVLRGDNPRDIEVSPNPDCEIIDGGRIMTMSANAVTHTSVEHIVNEIEKFGPQLLCAYPSALETLVRHLRDNGRRLSIQAVVTSSEVFRPESWALVEEMLGCRIADYYGQAERIAFASANAAGQYRFQHGYSCVEFVPYDGQRVPGDSQHRLYEIVGTSFWNSLLPIVRYRTGDLVRLPANWGERELEELSLGLRTFEGVLGRQQELLVCPQAVRITGIGCIPQDVRNVLRFQVVQEDLDEARILVLPCEKFSVNDAEVLLANARARIPSHVNVTVEIATRLERTPRGKTPLIVHRPPVHDALRRQGVEPLFTR